jgi:hypothetical protein
MAGAALLTGGGGMIVLVGADVAEAEPQLFLAVTTTSTWSPTSEARTV